MAHTNSDLLDLAETRLAAVLPQLTAEQLVGAYHLANLLPAGLETLWEQVDNHMERRGMPRPVALNLNADQVVEKSP